MISVILKLSVGLLTVLALALSVGAVMNISIYYPFQIVEGEPIPEHRWQSVRVAVLLTFAFYGFMYLFNASREVYPIHFLKVLLFMLSISGLIFFRMHNVSASEYLVLVSWFTWALIFHIGTRKKFKRYFLKK